MYVRCLSINGILVRVLLYLHFITFLAVCGHAQGKTSSLKEVIENTYVKLRSGNIEAVFAKPVETRRYSHGSYEFIEIKLTNYGRRKRVNAELRFVPNGIKIRSIQHLKKRTSKSLKLIKSDNGNFVKVPYISRYKPVTLLVEVQFGNSLEKKQNPVSYSQYSSMLIELWSRQKGHIAENVQTKLQWHIKDCSYQYHQSLKDLENTQLPLISSLVKLVQKRESDFNGKWIFKPSYKYQYKYVTRKKCRRYRKIWNHSLQKVVYKCRSYKKVKRKIRDRSRETPENQIFQFANSFIAVRGRKQIIKRGGNNYWVVNKITKDLKLYLSQKHNPSICTGAQQFTDYYYNKFNGIRKKQKVISQLIKQTHDLAVLNLQAYSLSIKGERDHNSFIENRQMLIKKIKNIKSIFQTKREYKKNKDTNKLKIYINKIALTFEDQKFSDEIIEQSNIRNALKIIKKNIKAIKQTITAVSFQELRNTLSLLEALDVLNRVSKDYKRLNQAVDGSIELIRKTHKKHCKCY